MSSATQPEAPAQPLPHGFTLVLCEPDSLHYGRFVDERGVFRGWAPWPHCDGRELRKSLTRLMRTACAAGAVDTMTARKVLDTARADDFMHLLIALREMTVYFEYAGACKRMIYVRSFQ